VIRKQKIAEFSKEPVYQYTLANKNGMELAVLNYGGTIRELLFQDKTGKKENRILSYKDIGLYEENPMFFGAIIGRVSGRIKNAAFVLAGKEYQVEKNEGNQHLHGGNKGFHHQFWTVKAIEEQNCLELHLQDKSNGYPGDLQVRVTYTLSNENVWSIHYHVETDHPTLCNMTNHTYFNLSGIKNSDILQHDLQIQADQVACVDEKTLPTGSYLSTKNDAVFNFTRPRAIGRYGMPGHKQQELVQGGYDHAFLLNKKQQDDLILFEKTSGIKVRVKTTEEAVVLYTCNKVTQAYPLESGILKPYAGLTLETQAMPDRIHSDRPELVVITKDKPYDSSTSYAFSLEK
jgi:aldose 1-epimerase